MTEETMPASAPAAQHTQPADNAPAQDYEQPAATPEHDEQHFQDEPAEEPADLGEILEEGRPKKLSGAQRAKLQRQHLENEVRQRDQRIAELEQHFADQDHRQRSAEAERQAEAQRKRDEAHASRVREGKSTISDFDRVMNKMAGVEVHEDVIEEIKSSEKSHLLAYHLANNPDKLAELNHMGDRERAREIGRLEASLKMPEGKKQTSAPPPPSTLRGGAAPHVALEQVNDMDTFAKRLIKDLDARKRR